ncbi:MAG: MBL fold metallo-hydrolase [Desulfobacula sp.]|nr:MBL fold metallo-hydrolase [Desulfobacula sp.]
MFIRQVKYSKDNLGYLVYSASEGIAIDAGGVEDILFFAEKNGIRIKYVSNTHSHQDHTPGNPALLKRTDARFIDCRQIHSDQVLKLDQEVLNIIPTPGHTEDSVTFKAEGFMVTGDTLFNGTVGNCFTGDLLSFFSSLKRLISFPDGTNIYGGHDYVLESMETAKAIEKDNPDIGEYMRKYDPLLIVSTLDDELRANPYIRFNAPSMINILKKRNLPANTEFERFKSIMENF